MRIKYENAEYIFYDWNGPIQIEGNPAEVRHGTAEFCDL